MRLCWAPHVWPLCCSPWCWNDLWGWWQCFSCTALNYSLFMMIILFFWSSYSSQEGAGSMAFSFHPLQLYTAWSERPDIKVTHDFMTAGVIHTCVSNHHSFTDCFSFYVSNSVWKWGEMARQCCHVGMSNIHTQIEQISEGNPGGMFWFVKC